MKKTFKDLIQDQSGVGMVEYALLAAMGTLGILAFGNVIDGGVTDAANSTFKGLSGMSDAADTLGAPNGFSGTPTP